MVPSYIIISCHHSLGCIVTINSMHDTIFIIPSALAAVSGCNGSRNAHTQNFFFRCQSTFNLLSLLICIILFSFVCDRLATKVCIGKILAMGVSVDDDRVA